MSKQEVAAIAKAMVAPGKGLLTMDESNHTCAVANPMPLLPPVITATLLSSFPI
jgi:hypothetical protein